MRFFIWPIDRTLSGATTPGQIGLGSDSSEGALRIPQSFSITGASPSDLLVSNTGHSFVGSYLSAEKLSVSSTVPADWAKLSRKSSVSPPVIVYKILFLLISCKTLRKEKKITDILINNLAKLDELSNQIRTYVILKLSTKVCVTLESC